MPFALFLRVSLYFFSLTQDEDSLESCDIVLAVDE